MAYQDIEAWKAMSKAALYQELVRLYGADVPPIDDITHIYVNNCYELGAEVGRFASDYFISLHPSEPPQYQRVDPEESIFSGDVYAWGKPGPYKIDLGFSPCKDPGAKEVKCPNCGSVYIEPLTLHNALPLSEQFMYACRDCGEWFNLPDEPAHPQAETGEVRDE